MLLVSGIQPSESAVCIHIFPPCFVSFPPTPFCPSRASQSTELSSLRYTSASCQLFYTRQCIYMSMLLSWFISQFLNFKGDTFFLVSSYRTIFARELGPPNPCVVQGSIILHTEQIVFLSPELHKVFSSSNRKERGH